MHSYDLILTLTGGLTAALILGYITHRIGLSPIVGYLVAGLLLGPHTPGFVADTSIAEEFAEVGVIVLMFGVGLQFHFEELLAVRRVAVPGAVVQSATATMLGALAAVAAGRKLVGGPRFRYGAVRREHGGSHSRACGQQRPAHRLGATPEQIDRERARAHQELFAG